MVEFVFRHIVINARKIRFKSFRGFRGHAQTVLQHRNGELWMRIRGHKETEIIVNLILVDIQLFDDLLELFKETETQMTIRQIKPGTIA